MRAVICDLEERDEDRNEIREKLQEAVHDGPPTPMTQSDWDDISTEVRRRHAERQGQAAD
jgi:hypothetical protein